MTQVKSPIATNKVEMNEIKAEANRKSGFTLIELSIVLVIIGLIVGGVLVGQDLIKAASIRATVSQIEKYSTAVNTFRGKYNGIPGDIANGDDFFASITNDGESNQGDGDGLVESVSDSSNTLCSTEICISGESSIFWYMLSQANLIPESITTTNYEAITLTVGDSVIPQAKVGRGARVAVQAVSGVNYFAIANFGSAALTAGSETYTAGMAVVDAYQFDSKLDDGVPNRGSVISSAIATALPGTAANGAATGAVAGTTCYDSTAGVYVTTTINSNDNTNKVNCNLSIKASF